MHIRFVKVVLGGLLLTAGLQAKVEFEAIHTGQQAGESSGLSRACTLGLRPLRSFFRENGVRFDPRVVHSHRGRYCHIYYAPTRAGFEAAEVGPSWVAGSVNGGQMLLVPKQDAEMIAEDDLPAGVPFMLSKLQWHSSGFELFQGGQREQSRVLIYGESVRELLGGAIRDQEYEYLLKVEFGVDVVKKKSKAR
ncbi:MAG: hypothetical protein NTW74_11195 [Acidobacteria bacterium]|nr:hypothetical protein [Acidobacteriota bacterium]